MTTNFVRINSAMTLLPFATDAQKGILLEWINHLAMPANILLGDAEPEIQTSVMMNQVTCFLESPDDKDLATRYMKLIKASKFQEAELTVLQQVFKAFKGKFAAWLLLDGNQQQTGWSISGIFPLEKIWGLIPDSIHEATLKSWFAQYPDINAFTSFGRSVSANRFSIFSFELFGGDTTQDLKLYLELMETLHIPPIPEPILQLIGNEEPEYLEVKLWLTSQGILQASLLMPNPSENLVMQMAMVLAEDMLEPFSLFEGAMANAPYLLEAMRTSEGFDVQLRYSPSGER